MPQEEEEDEGAARLQSKKNHTTAFFHAGAQDLEGVTSVKPGCGEAGTCSETRPYGIIYQLLSCRSIPCRWALSRTRSSTETGGWWGGFKAECVVCLNRTHCTVANVPDCTVMCCLLLLFLYIQCVRVVVVFPTHVGQWCFFFFAMFGAGRKPGLHYFPNAHACAYRMQFTYGKQVTSSTFLTMS